MKEYKLFQGKKLPCTMFRLSGLMSLQNSSASPGNHCFMPGFHMIVGDRSQSLGSPVNCSRIVAIIWKLNFHFVNDHRRSLRLLTITTIMIAGTESAWSTEVTKIRHSLADSLRSFCPDQDPRS